MNRPRRHVLVAVLAFVLGVIATSRAEAQPDLAPLQFAPTRYGAEPEPEPVPIPGEPKSPKAALALSLGATAAGVALIVTDASDLTTGAGVALALIGPHTGYFYSGLWGRSLRVAGVQAAGVLAVSYGVGLAVGDGLSVPSTGSDNSMLSGVLVVAGSAAVVGSSVFAIFDSYESTKLTNERRVELSPAAIIGPQRSTGFGVAVAGEL
jgi:hypothetical protein